MGWIRQLYCSHFCAAALSVANRPDLSIAALFLFSATWLLLPVLVFGVVVAPGIVVLSGLLFPDAQFAAAAVVALGLGLMLVCVVPAFDTVDLVKAHRSRARGNGALARAIADRAKAGLERAHHG